MDTTRDSIDLTGKLNFSLPLADQSSLNPNDIGFSEIDISDTAPTVNGTRSESRLSSLFGAEEQTHNESAENQMSTNTATFSKSGISKESANVTANDVSLVSEDEENEKKSDKNNTTEVEQLQEALAEITESIVDGISVMQSELEATHTLHANERNLFKNSFVELGRRLWESNAKVQHYTKGCLWSPDGTCVLVPVHLDGMHIVELPTDLYQAQSIALDRKVSGLPSAVHVKEGGTVYDCAWYPHMNSNMPETCCWIASRQHEPIHMWDAFNGELRCTYRGYDDVDEIEAAISVIFSNDGENIYAGYKKSIKVFDTNLPGRDSSCISVKQAISCFALNDSNDSTITSGSWNGYINHYDLRVPKLGPLFTLGGHNGGITWLRYAPNGQNNCLLYSGARKDNKILQWDMRNYTEPVRTFTRNVDTNQRIYFDLSPQCEWLVSGDTKGLLRIWDLCSETESYEFQLHEDCCNGVNFHPTLPILATTSGQYHFVNVIEDDEDAKSINQEIKATEMSKNETTVDYENSLLFLWFDENHAKSAADDIVEK